MNKQVKLIHLGLVPYTASWNYQLKLFNKILKEKKRNRNRPENEKQPTSNYLLCCEHPPVFTLGRNGKAKNLLISQKKRLALDVRYYRVERGGDITYHGPGQVVVYPIIDMENFFTDIRRYMRLLEEAVIQTLAHYAIPAGRIAQLTGVWVDPSDTIKARKICALGVKTSRWVTLHGLALNINVDLHYFDYIVPCGLANYTVTSMERELKEEQHMGNVSHTLLANIVTLFGMQIKE